jgi:hypothetical protein
MDLDGRRVVVAAVVIVAAGAAIAVSSNRVLAGGGGTPDVLAPPELGSGTAGFRVNDTPANGETPREHARRVVDGKTWSIKTFTNEGGQLCAGERVVGISGAVGQGLTCRDPATLFANGPLVFFVGRQRAADAGPHWDNIWVWGWAAETVSDVELVMSDCSRIALRIDRARLFFHVVNAAQARRDVAPIRIVADTAGREIVAKTILIRDPLSGDVRRGDSSCD